MITGVTGHIGFRVLVVSLQQGYKVRATTRRPEQADKLKKTASLQPYLDSIEFVQVADITAANAYNEAIKGVAAVIHVASPIPLRLGWGDGDIQQILYDPAEKGTTRVLEAAVQASSVRRVVITSSVVVLASVDGADRIARK